MARELKAIGLSHGEIEEWTALSGRTLSRDFADPEVKAWIEVRRLELEDENRALLQALNRDVINAVREGLAVVDPVKALEHAMELLPKTVLNLQATDLARRDRQMEERLASLLEQLMTGGLPRGWPEDSTS